MHQYGVIGGQEPNLHSGLADLAILKDEEKFVDRLYKSHHAVCFQVRHVV